jgi:hypothetical protein
MTIRLQHQLEISRDAATLYLSGILSEDDVPQLRQLCGGLPPWILTLRVDLHGASATGPELLACIRAVLDDWRRHRGGEFHLTLRTSHLLASYQNGTPGPSPWTATTAPVASSPSLMGIFL